MRLANASLAEPFDAVRLHELAAALGADVPLFLTSGPQLGEGDGTDLTPLELPRDYAVLVLLPHGATKHSTKAVYDAFDDRNGEIGFAERRDELVGRLGDVSCLADIAAWPRNDLAHSPLATELERVGAVRADVSGAGPALYGLFESEAGARQAAIALADRGEAWVAIPAWYG
jgi:4-diphosphocytidyl-2-C-methyl-D-erythritol kinase